MITCQDFFQKSFKKWNALFNVLFWCDTFFQQLHIPSIFETLFSHFNLLLFFCIWLVNVYYVFSFVVSFSHAIVAGLWNWIFLLFCKGVFQVVLAHSMLYSPSFTKNVTNIHISNLFIYYIYVCFNTNMYL